MHELLIGRDKSGREERLSAVEKEALALLSRRWKTCPVDAENCSERSAFTNVLTEKLALAQK